MSKNALRLVSTKGLEREDWLSVRKQGIGSSDASSAVGLNPYKSPLELWMEKTGRAENDVSNDAAYWGTTLEPIVAQEYSLRSGFKVRRVNAVLQHPSVPFMLANLDREIVAHPEGAGILECKTAGHYSAKHWEDGVPEWYQLQVLHQLAVTGRKWADVAVLIGGQDFRIFRINRDEDMISNLVQLEREFWKLVEEDIPPPADGSESSRKALSLLYPRDSGTVMDCTTDSAINDVFSRLVDARAIKEEAEEEEEKLRQQIQEVMGDATQLLLLGGKVSWKKSKDSQGIDLKKILEVHPEFQQQFPLVKPGSRRFVVSI